MKIVAIYGPPACGKLAVAKALSQLTQFPIFHNHLTVNLAKELAQFRTELYFDLVESLRLAVIEAFLRSNENGLIFTLFYWNLQRDNEFIARVKDVVTSKGGQINFICLNPKAEILRKRVYQKGRIEYGKPASVQELQKAMEGWSYSEVPCSNSFVLDNSSIPPKEAADLIASRFSLI
jgi:hypothetical protein